MTVSVFPFAVRRQVSFCSPKSFGTITRNDDFCHCGTKCVG